MLEKKGEAVFEDCMVVHIKKNLKESPKNLPEIMNKLSKLIEYKVCINKSLIVHALSTIRIFVLKNPPTSSFLLKEGREGNECTEGKKI